MTAFFVHGVPDTSVLWNGVRDHLDRPGLDHNDVIAPNLPGFDAPVPDGFGASKEEYVDWLIAQLAEVGEPVDIVGHDWGSLIVQRAVTLRPDLIRTWAAGGGAADREYVWHELAQMWQTPEVGEQIMEAMTPEAIAETLGDQVGGPERAAEVGSHVDATMKACVLKLYRSAVGGFGAWHDDIDRVLPTRPGIVFWGGDDPYVTPDFGERLAQRTGAQLVMFPDSGHWWPATKPAEVASGLRELWARA